MARDDMYNKLVICNDAASQILYEWEEVYKHKYRLIQLPKVWDKSGLFINEFLKQQMTLINEA